MVVRCDAAILPQLEHKRTLRGHRECVAVGRVEERRGSSGHLATLRFLSPLIEPDRQISASGSRTRLHALLLRATPSAVSEHSSEFIGCPISRSFTTYCVCLELRSLPSTGITQLPRYYEPLRHPKAPSLSLTGFRLVVADHALGLPVFRALSLCTCCRHYPGAASGRIASLISSRRINLPRKGCRVGLRIVLFEDCSAFTRVTACTLALSPIRDTLIEGFSHFVTSMTAPIASGWSGCRVGLAPTGKRRLVTAHTQRGHFLLLIGSNPKGTCHAENAGV